jgi:putative protein kinase ArgK-like GTPase of G3E family
LTGSGDAAARLGALVGLSRTRVGADALAEAGQVLDRVGRRRGLSARHTVVALAGATGSGKSTLFNALIGADLSRTGVRRPTTASPVAWTAEPATATALLDHLGVPRHARHGLATPVSAALEGLVLVDLPDHDSADPRHRAEADRLLALVDAVVWVADPEKYADAALHERYLRPFAGYADVTLVVLNQADRLPGDATEQVLHDLRRLLDEDGLALGEHGEAGAAVLAVSALTGAGLDDLRAALGALAPGGAGQGARQSSPAERRLGADVDRVVAGLRPLYAGHGRGDGRVAGLTDEVCEEFAARLADAVGAAEVGAAVEDAWARAAKRACACVWFRPRTGTGAAEVSGTAGGDPAEAADGAPGGGPESGDGRGSGDDGGRGDADADVRADLGARAGAGPVAASRPLTREAVRVLAGQAAYGLPAPWARAVHEAAERGGAGLAAALDAAVPRWTGRPAVPARGGRGAASQGQGQGPSQGHGYGPGAVGRRPRWWAVVGVAQWLLALLTVAGLAWAGAALVGGASAGGAAGWRWPAALAGGALLTGPLLGWAAGLASAAEARRQGDAAEWRLRDAVEECGRERVLVPLAAELERYREVRERYGALAATSPLRVTEFSTMSE